MKKSKRVLTVAAIGLIIGGGIMVAAGMAAGGRVGFRITSEGIKTSKDYDGEFIEKSASLEGIEKLNLAIDTGNIEVLEGDDFHVEYGYFSGARQMREDKNGDTFKLDAKYSSGVSFSFLTIEPINNSSRDGYVKVYIPRGKSLKSIQISNDYGDISAQSGNADEFSVTTDSGNINLANINSQIAKITTEYGTASVNTLKSDELYVDSGSHEVELTNIDTGKAKVACEYGNITLDGFKAEDLNVASGSGNLSIKEAEFTKVVMYNEYGWIKLDDLKTEYLEAKSGSKEIIGNKVTAAESKLELDHGDCEFSEFTVDKLTAENEYGRMTLALTGKEKEYDVEAVTEYGRIKINDMDCGGDLVRETGSAKKLKLSCDSGDIRITTAD